MKAGMMIRKDRGSTPQQTRITRPNKRKAVVANQTRPRDSGTATDPSAKPSRPAIPPETRLFPSLRVYLCSVQRMPNQA